MTHLANYRTNTYKWYDEHFKLHGNELLEKQNEIYKLIDQLQPGRRYDLFSIPKANQEYFVRFACYYITEHGGMDASGVYFSNDWRYLHRKMTIK